MICQPLSNSDAIYRRAGGRRKYNKVRQFQAAMRLLQVVALQKELGLGRGIQSRIAKRLGVHRSTICRDMAKLERGFWGGREAEEKHRADVRMQRHVRAEDKAELESERVADDAVAPECDGRPRCQYPGRHKVLFHRAGILAHPNAPDLAIGVIGSAARCA